ATLQRERNDAFYAAYQAGTLDIAAYVDFATAAWRERPADELSALQQRFVDEMIRPVLRPAALDLVRGHQARGDLVAIITATNEFVTQPIAAAFGVVDLLAIELERDAGGTITGRIRGVPTFREGKVLRTEQWLASRGLRWGSFARISVYSDSPNDLPLLERATDPVATNPVPALEALARERGWRVLRLFDDQETD
ncbi:MAG TPA: HAD-IB family hydrolase, partial [Ideonella sp.]|nr:HAD-IB family hydrolase [Ideonella sp.]